MKKVKITIVLLMLGVLFLVWLFAVYRFGTRTYSSLESYRKAGGELYFDIPDDAVECRFTIRKYGISRSYIYSFKLESQSYHSYVEELVQRYNLEGKGDSEQDELDAKYGYRAWYGKKVADCYDRNYTLNNFPVELPFANVIDDSINDYTVIVYDPKGVSGFSYGIVTDEDDCRFVVYSTYSK